MTQEREGKVRIDSESDIVSVRKAVRDLAMAMDFGKTETTRLVTAASELARNVFHYAGSGHMQWRAIEANSRFGIELVFMDQGPGIADVEQAMEFGFTTRGGLGLGLPGAKRLTDEMDIRSEAGKGTVVSIRKWKNR